MKGRAAGIRIGGTRQYIEPADHYDDITHDVEQLRAAGLNFRSDIISGPGGQQILLQDPSGNLIELFQPAER